MVSQIRVNKNRLDGTATDLGMVVVGDYITVTPSSGSNFKHIFKATKAAESKPAYGYQIEVDYVSGSTQRTSDNVDVMARRVGDINGMMRTNTDNTVDDNFTIKHNYGAGQTRIFAKISSNRLDLQTINTPLS